MPKMIKMRLRIIVFSLLAGFGVLSGVFLLLFYYPIEWSEWRARFRVRAAGVESVSLRGNQMAFHAYERDGCHVSPVTDNTLCECVALLHGAGDSALSFETLLTEDQETWKKLNFQIPFKLFAVSLPGTLGTPMPKDLELLKVKNLAQEIGTALGRECSRWTVVGNSFGGWIAIWMTLNSPKDFVKRLGLLSPAGFLSPEQMKDQRELLTKQDSQNDTLNEKRFEQVTLAQIEEFQKKAFAQDSSPPPRYVLQAMKRRKEVKAAYEMLRQQDLSQHFNSELDLIRVPTIVIWGKEDQVIPIEQGRQLREFNHRWIWKEVTNCGHMPQKECPASVMESISQLTNFGSM